MQYLSVALTMLPTLTLGLAMNYATSKAVEAAARQPEAASKINSILVLGLALSESIAIYCFVIALMLVIKL